MTEQKCPACRLVEAAGSYCTKCLTRTGPADAVADSPRHRAARDRGSKRHPEGERAAAGHLPANPPDVEAAS